LSAYSLLPRTTKTSVNLNNVRHTPREPPAGSAFRQLRWSRLSTKPSFSKHRFHTVRLSLGLVRARIRPRLCNSYIADIHFCDVVYYRCTPMALHTYTE
jgi:hypothetical protein